MNLSLILIFVMILVIIPALVRRLFPKEIQFKNNAQENLQENAIKNFREESISDIIAASSGLLALQNDVEEKQDINKIIQKKLIFEKLIMIKAPEGENFMGYALLQSLQNAGLKFSSKGLFYYINNNVDIDDKFIHTQDNILFELSPSIEPYRFNLAEIGDFKTPGLVLKVMESADEDSAQQIAEMLADDLGGVVEC